MRVSICNTFKHPLKTTTSSIIKCTWIASEDTIIQIEQNQGKQCGYYNKGGILITI